MPGTLQGYYAFELKSSHCASIARPPSPRPSPSGRGGMVRRLAWRPTRVDRGMSPRSKIGIPGPDAGTSLAGENQSSEGARRSPAPQNEWVWRCHTSGSWWSIGKRVIGGLLKGKVGGIGSFGIGYNLSLAGVFILRRPGTGALPGLGDSDRFLAGRGPGRCRYDIHHAPL